VCEREDANRTRVAGYLDEIQGVVANTLNLFRGGAVGFIDWLDAVSKRRHSLTRVSCATRRSVEVVMWKLFAPKNRLEPATQGATKVQPAVRVGANAPLR
jgi:hypothetical protein